MKKIYIVLAGAFLILLIITSLLLSLEKKTSKNTLNQPFPTSVPGKEFNSEQINQQNAGSLSPSINNRNQIESNLSNPPNSLNLSDEPIDVSLIAPVETEDFKMQFNTQLDKLVVEKKTPEAEKKFADWAKKNNYPQLIGNLDKVFMANTGNSPHDFNPMLDFFSIFMTLGQGSLPTTSNSSPSVSPTSSSPVINLNSVTNNSSISLSQTQSRVYYAQCGDQGSLPLPDGCNLCSAGCGPTTVSMIASSYLGPKYDPKAIVDIYQSKNYLLGCSGSRYTDAHELLKDLGLKTTDYLSFNSERSDTVVPQLRKYIDAGWTFFTLARFCSDGCGHYFWITNIDIEGNIIAYDPAYGRYEIPYNENSRYPYPLYLVAFGVKK